MSSELFDFEQRMNAAWQQRVNSMPSPLTAWINSKNAEIDTLLAYREVEEETLASCERQREEEIERIIEWDEEEPQYEPANYICYGELTVGELLEMLQTIVANDPSAASKPIFHEFALESLVA
jgi:hypothetical protein